MSFKDNLRKICAEQNTTPSAIVRRLGLSTSKVSAWYSGSLPKEDVLENLARELNCPVSAFFATEEESFIRNSDLTDDEKDIILTFRKLNRKQKHEFMVYIYDYEK